jgi:phage terminase small subunit
MTRWTTPIDATAPVQGRKEDDLSNARLVRQQHGQPVDAHAKTARRPLTSLVDQAVHGLQQLGRLFGVSPGADQITQKPRHVARLLGT